MYPAAGLDVVIHPLSPTPEELESQAIVPPITVDGYWVSDFGTPGDGSTNTTYILGHSWEGRDAPFNRLSAASAPGDLFEATTASGTMRYRVDSVDTYVKASLKDSPIWTAVPNRLVLISCYTEDPWGKTWWWSRLRSRRPDHRNQTTATAALTPPSPSYGVGDYSLR